MKGSLAWKTRVSVQKLQGGKRVVGEPGLSGVGTGSVSKVRPEWRYS